MYKIKDKPLTLSGILREDWLLYESTFLYLLPWSFTVAVIHLLPYLYGYNGFYHYYRAIHEVSSWIGLAVFIILLFVEAFLLIILFNTMNLLAKEQRIDLPNTFKAASKQFLILYFAMAVYFILVNIGLILLIFPGIFIAVVFSMFLPLIVIEGQSIYQAFVGSFRLVWGHWWQTFFALVLPYLLAYLARVFVKYAFTGSNWFWFSVDIITFTLLLPYFYGAVLIQYYHLKFVKSLPKPVANKPRLQS